MSPLHPANRCVRWTPAQVKWAFVALSLILIQYIILTIRESATSARPQTRSGFLFLVTMDDPVPQNTPPCLGRKTILKEGWGSSCDANDGHASCVTSF